MAENNNPYRGLPPEQKIRNFLFDSAGSLTAIAGFGEILLIEAQKPEFQACLPPEFQEYLGHMLTAAQRLAEEHQKLRESMWPPPDAESIGL